MSPLVAVIGFAALFVAFGLLGLTVGRWNRGCAGAGGCAGGCMKPESCRLRDDTPGRSAAEPGARPSSDERGSAPAARARPDGHEHGSLPHTYDPESRIRP